MAEDLQGLLNKINTEGIRKAEEESDKIISAAQKKAEKIIADAKSEAESIIRNGENNAASSQEKSEAAIRQAARDILIALKSDILARLQAVTKECVAKAMTPELMGQLILEMAKGYTQKNPTGDAGVEVILTPKDLASMESLLKGALLSNLRGNPEISVGNDFAAGLQIGFKGDDVYLDFSDEALADVICEFVGPKLAAVLKNGQEKSV